MSLKTGFLFLVISCLAIGCSKAQKKPRYLSFQQEQDSLKVSIYNGFLCPMFLKFRKNTDQETQIIDFKGQE